MTPPHAYLAAFIVIAVSARAQPSFERVNFLPGTVASEGNFSLVSSVGEPVASVSTSAPVILECGSFSALLPLALATSVVSLAVDAPSSGASPAISWTSTAEAEGVEFHLHRAMPFAGGWIVDAEIESVAATGTGSSYAATDPSPYTFGDPERTYLLELIEPGGGRTIVGPVSLYHAPVPEEETWAIF